VSKLYPTEAAMVACWLVQLSKSHASKEWTVYPETAGWDVLLVHQDGYQLGIEAKLALNAHVVAQSLEGTSRYYTRSGPDYRAVMVPADKSQGYMGPICRALGVCIIAVRPPERHITRGMGLPCEEAHRDSDWPCWLPAERCPLPEYIPDVEAGHPSPVALTYWKIKAIRLMIVLERRGFVTRADMRVLQISPSRWCDGWHGFLDRGAEGYVRGDRTPNLRAQHPRNYAEIEADIATWSKDLAPLDRVEAAA
jgi:hypothetical protein